MKRYVILITIFLLLIVPNAAFADSLDRILEAGTQHNGDLTLFGDNITIEDGAVVTGDLTVFGGNATISGQVDGDLVLFGGHVDLMQTAVIDGNCVLLGGHVSNNADTACNVWTGNDEFDFDVTAFSGPEFGEPSRIGRFLGGIGSAVFSALFMAVLAFIVASVAPTHLGRVEETAEGKPVVSGTVGLLTLFAVPSLIAILAPLFGILILACGLGLLGFPLLIALALGLAGAMIIGWIAMGDMVGQRVVHRMQWKGYSAPLIAALGTAVLTFAINLLGQITFLAGIASMLIAFVGIGAVALTKFGTQTYPGIIAGNITIDADKEAIVLNTLPDDN